MAEEKVEMLLRLAELCQQQGASYEQTASVITQAADSMKQIAGRLAEKADSRTETVAKLKAKADGAQNAALAEVSMDEFAIVKSAELIRKRIDTINSLLDFAEETDSKTRDEMSELLYILTN